MKTIKTLTIALASIGFLTAPMAASATIYTETVETRINKSDLLTEAGLQRVYRKLSNKAESQCQSNGLKPVSATRKAKKCAATLLNEFVMSVNHERLTEIHRKAIQS